MAAASELPITTLRESADARDLAETIFGDGTVVVGASYRGDIDSAGIYEDGDAVSPGATPADRGIIMSTGNVEDYTNEDGDANQQPNTSTNTSGRNNRNEFNELAGASTFDSSRLDVDFIPDGDTLTMQFVFASEELPEFQNSVYQDVVGVWINGVHTPLEAGNGDIDPGNINSDVNQNLFLDNAGSAYNTELDGLTLTLTLKIPVNPGVVNTLRVGIADVADSSFDSHLLIAADSVQTSLVALNDEDTIVPGGSKEIDVLANDSSSTGGALTITHINGIEVLPGDSVLLATGQTISLNDDGALTVDADNDVEEFNFTYAISDGINTDTGLVNINSVPCFVAGTLIATPSGQVPIEQLKIGDLVLTRDDGPQPVRWTGQKTVAAEDEMAPIRIAAGALGDHGTLWLSPEHRVLIRNSLAELFFGEAEVLVAAKNLVNYKDVTRVEGGDVTYVHLLFDRHQVIYSEGLPTESFLPGPQTTSNLESSILREILAIFPQLNPTTGAGYSAAARRTLRSFEADVLRMERVA